MTQTLRQKAAFDPEDFDDVLSWNFTRYREGLEGVTPEPSTSQVLKYQRTMKNIVRPAVVARAQAEADPDRKMTVEEVNAMFNDESDAEAMQAFEDVLRATAELCSNKPSKSDLNVLPHRMKLHYVGYIAGKFLSSGEASASATS